MTWLPSRYDLRSDDTMADLTPITHEEPLLNDLDPSDPTVVALTTHEESRG